MAGVQVNIRLDDTVVEELDGWAVVRGMSRPDLVREVLTDWLRRQRRREIEQEYRSAYREHPESADDLERAAEAARRLTEEETWQPWW